MYGDQVCPEEYYQLFGKISSEYEYRVTYMLLVNKFNRLAAKYNHLLDEYTKVVQESKTKQQPEPEPEPEQTKSIEPPKEEPPKEEPPKEPYATEEVWIPIVEEIWIPL
jgi:ADP-heptose:LPS heptosyltransferase